MNPPLISRAVKTYLRTGLRGRTRLTLLLARHSRALQCVPVNFERQPTVYMDLRMSSSHSWFLGSPWRESPRELAEQQVMRGVVCPGDVAFDIGANIGLHMSLLSNAVGGSGRVIAFEPNPDLHRLLVRTAEEAGNCEVHCLALSDAADTATLFVPDDHSMGSLADWTSGRRGATRQVVCGLAPLDAMVKEGRIPSPDFIKCDVEGAELKVFRGGRDTLDSPDGPVLLFEVGENTSRGFGLTKWSALEFLETLDRARYTFYELIKEGRVLPLNRSHPRNLDVLAVPESRRDRLNGLTGAA